MLALVDNLNEQVGQRGIEIGMGLAGNPVNGFINGQGRRIRWIRGQMVEGLCKGNDPGQEWNALRLEPMGKALSIPSLMVAKDDLADLRRQACVAKEQCTPVRVFLERVRLSRWCLVLFVGGVMQGTHGFSNIMKKSRSE